MLQIGNGFGQGFGWPAILKLIGTWFRRGERDSVLGWWSTSYILGGFLATSLAAWAAVHIEVITHASFHSAYLVSSMVLLCTALFFIYATRGLPQLATGLSPISRASDGRSGAWKAILTNRTIRIVSATYFFLKMTRYTLLFWLPHYLVTTLDSNTYSATRTASFFELFGFLGPIAVGYATERWLHGRRLALGAGLLFALAFLYLLHPLLANSGWFSMIVSISLMGILIHAADLLISGMTVLEAVPNDLHGRAVGFVNGVGSIGQAISPALATIFVAHMGGTKLFDLFVFFALAAGAICAFGASHETPIRCELTVQSLSLPIFRYSLRGWTNAQ